jgi:hypothetical protein
MGAAERARVRHPERLAKHAAIVSALALLLATAVSSAHAQVGHRPSDSPYRDIYKGHTFTPLVGWIGGKGGEFRIAPHQGVFYGFRYDVRTASALQFGLQVGQADLDRLIVDPFVEVEDRMTGPVRQRLSFVELDLQLNLTGGKTWHRLAPYVGLGGGLAFASGTAADTSGFELGNKFYFAPHAGIRFFVTPRLHLRGDARLGFWKLNYPDSFTQPPPEEPSAAPVITDGKVSEWSTVPWFQAGLGYSFSF